MGYIFVVIVILLIGLTSKPIRKAMGLLLIIIGAIQSFTGLGLIVGIPMIFVGALMLFWKGGGLSSLSSHSEEHKNLSLKQEELINAIIKTLDNLGWKFEVLSQNHFFIKTPMNIRTFGENININVFPDGTVHVKSQCSQSFDWGKNKVNIQTFFDELQKVIEGKSVVI